MDLLKEIVGDLHSKIEKAFDEGRAQQLADAAAATIPPFDDKAIDSAIAELLKRSLTLNSMPQVATPLAFKRRLMLHQCHGLGRLLQWDGDSRIKGGILADDKGLGKRAQVIALLCKRRPSHQTSVLIVVPPSLMQKWKDEFESALSGAGLNVLYIHDHLECATAKAKVQPSMAMKHNVFVVAYSFITHANQTKPHYLDDFVQWLRPRTLIVDEAHHAVNPEGQLHKGLKAIPAQVRILLTGSPFRHGPPDVRALGSLIGIHPLFDDEVAFNKAFTIPGENGKCSTRKQQNMLNMIVRPYMIRRFRDDYLNSFPPLHQEVIGYAIDGEAWRPHPLYEEKSAITNTEALKTLYEPFSAELSAINDIAQLQEMASRAYHGDMTIMSSEFVRE